MPLSFDEMNAQWMLQYREHAWCLLLKGDRENADRVNSAFALVAALQDVIVARANYTIASVKI